MNFFEQNQIVLEGISNIATIVGVPFAVYLFLNEKKKQRFEQELNTYNDMSKEYREFMKLCIEHPELQLYPYDTGTSQKFSPKQKAQQLIMFEILVSMCESAYFQYKDHDTAFKEAQWSGWHQYMLDWFENEDFRIAWNIHLSSEFDKGFLAYMANVSKESDQNLERRAGLNASVNKKIPE